MLILAAGNQSSSDVRVLARHSGFSLIELLVAMCLIALFSGMAMVSIGNRESGSDELQDAAVRLSELMISASTRAIVTARPVGMHVLRSDLDDGLEIRWSHWQQGQWRLWTEEMASLKLPSRVHIEIEVEGSQIELDRVNVEQLHQTLPLPSLVFYQTGEVTPFMMELRDDSPPTGTNVATLVRLSNLDTGEIELDW